MTDCAILVLDHGYVDLQEVMGSDAVIADAARTTYNRNELIHEVTSRDVRLIKRLMRDRHTSPFEMAEMRFLVSLPIFVARQWVRHRTANLNEFSARYSEMPEQFYIPDLENIRVQHVTNKQMSGERLSEVKAGHFRQIMIDRSKAAFDTYHTLIANGMSREMARIVLPLNTYTKWMWKCDLHNILNFLRLRLAPDAQAEIRAYAAAVASFVKQKFPVVWEAFLENNPDLVPVIPHELRP